MKKLMLILLFAMLALPSLAQDDKAQKIKTIVDYKSELGLSDEQVTGITSTLKDFQTRVAELRQQLKDSETQYASDLAAHAPLAQIKAQLRKSSDLQFQVRYLDVVTARRVEDILSSAQLEKWKQIQAKVRKK